MSGAESPGPARVPQFMVRTWRTDEGLPRNEVLSLAQTTEGYLWIGSENTLSRFDGVHFQAFTPQQHPGLPFGRMVALCPDRTGRLWIGTDEGQIGWWESGDRFGKPVGETGSEIYRIVQDERGLIWLGLGNGILPLINHTINPASRIVDADRPARRLVVAGGGEGLWGDRDGTIGQVRDGRFHLVQPLAGDERIYANSLFPRRAGGVWVLEQSPKVLRQGHPDGFQPGRPVPFPLAAWVSACLDDHRGNIWIGDAAGLYRWAPDGSHEHYTEAEGLGDKSITVLFEDAEHNLWAGTQGGGLSRIRPRAVKVLAPEDRLESPVVHSLTRLGERAAFASGSGHALWQVTADRARPVPTPFAARVAWVDSQTNLWLTAPPLTMRFPLEGVVAGNAAFRLTASTRAIYEQSPGVIWLATEHGLIRSEHDRATKYTLGAAGPNIDCRALAADGAGGLWVGTHGLGLARWHGGILDRWQADRSLTNDYIATLMADPDGTLWLGTRGRGLGRLRQGKFVRFTSAQGLPDDTVVSLLDDQAGNLWLGMPRGISRVSRAELEAVATGRSPGLHARTLGSHDGLAGAECTGEGQPNAQRMHDGALWFATTRGVAMVNPAAVESGASPIRVQLEAAVLDDGEPWPLTGTAPAVTLAASGRNLEIRYTAFNFAAPETTRFRHQMTGLDEDWIDAGAQRFARYLRIPPGQFTFRVSAANGEGRWSEPVTLAVIVPPRFWETWWFRGAGVLALGASALAFHRRRLARVERARAAQQEFARQLIASQEGERKRIAAELHDSLEQNLLVIKNQATLAQGRTGEIPRVVASLAEISATASDAIEEVRGIAANLRPQQLDRLGLTRALKTMIRGVSESSAIQFVVEIDNIDNLLPKEFEINIYRVVQETLNNMLKHSAATMATVRVKHLPAEIRLTVEDNGRGFEPSTTLVTEGITPSFGLAGIAERVKIMDGKLQVTAAPGRGAVFQITVAISPPAMTSSAS